ncbi:unnamed protein product [Clavelina lepadiformis]|uniref:procollagen-proline 3-dioxygenase n=1 Tax=Clavelina lepadiformis TaxID=159417 RepID=A0ABP0GI50_CLALP
MKCGIMPFSSILFLNNIFCTFIAVLVAVDSDIQTFDQLYANGIDAYWNEDWKDCIHYFEKSIKSYRFMQDSIKNCSKQCSSETNSKNILDSYHHFIVKAACLEKCEKEKFGDSRKFLRISKELHESFKQKRLYIYLQFAYFRNGDFAKSLAASHTYNLYDPDDQMMISNMDYFRGHENTTGDMFINLEALPHQTSYDLGIEAYNREDYKDAISHFEEALKRFYEEEEGCRALCEGEYDVGKEYSDIPTPFHLQIVYHYRDVMECYLRCPTELGRVSLKSSINNYLPKHYFFLHSAYHHMHEDMKASECAKAYLLFFPDNLFINSFLERMKVSDEVKARKEAVNFQHRIKLQSELLKYLYQKFGIRDYDKSIFEIYPSEDLENLDILKREKASKNGDTLQPVQGDEASDLDESGQSDEDDGYNSMQEKTNDLIASKDSYNEYVKNIEQKKLLDAKNLEERLDVDISPLQDKPIGRQTIDSSYIVTIPETSDERQSSIAEGPLLFENTVMLANSTQMVGPERFAIDGMATENECKDLIDLQLTGGLFGDGYKGRAQPHTEHELFQGITVHRAAQLAADGQLPASVAKLFYDLSERVLMQVKAYFKLDELYFDFTHLVCRTAVKDTATERDDLSHPIHADNCILHENGQCIKESPAFTWRDYSSILYLNSGFDGGEFIMTDFTARRVMLQVRPKCGRLVSFSAGKECLHGVKPVTRGRRCAMALWFTQDPAQNEVLRIEAKKILDELIVKDEL